MRTRTIAGLVAAVFLTACAGKGDFSGEEQRGLTSRMPDAEAADSWNEPRTDLKERYGALLHAQPVEGVLTSGFGPRKLGKSKRAKVKLHGGIDVASPRGTAVQAAGAGTVVIASRKKGFGNLVQIEHEEGVTTRYAHLAKIFVKRGQTIAAGAKVGAIGKTGKATGYHLHFEVLIDHRQVDPLTVVNWTFPSRHQFVENDSLRSPFH